MATQVIYPLYKGFLLTASTNVSLNVDTTTDGPYVSLIDAGAYTISTATNDFYSTAVAGEVGTPQRISTPTTTAGTFDGDDVTFTAVTGASVEALIIYRHNSGANTTWKLVYYTDINVTGLPVTPNGGNISIVWAVSGIFTI